MQLRKRIETMQHLLRQHSEALAEYSKPDDIVQMVLLLEEMHFYLRDHCPPELAELKAELLEIFKGEYQRSGVYA